MTESRTAAHDAELPYAETSLGELSLALAQHIASDGRTLSVSGVCPRCAGPTVSEYAYGLPGIGTKAPWPFRDRRAEDSPDVVGSEVHFCECGHPHPSMPPDAAFIGCGASWRVRTAETGDTPS
ncbi:hypothetical protein OG259_33145 [Streptomyces sp. NBC_00250]|uniref:hypothetical protein n=1 Tax=Streptomyces sp. NBC_00250 TaxID=2903641 RepID=UPI002E2E33C8|nr:hypothetical protein [Streptomyces sp. NBC_00250]